MRCVDVVDGRDGIGMGLWSPMRSGSVWFGDAWENGSGDWVRISQWDYRR